MPDNKQFLVDIGKFVSKSNISINTYRTFLAYEVFSRVIDRTPIALAFEDFSGRAKYNWQCTIDSMSTRVLKGTDKSGDATKARMLKTLERVTGDSTIFLANSLPYITTLEDGLYIKNPVRGTWNKQTGKYEIRSAGGYSKQTGPVGMVKLTMTEIPALRAQALRKAKAIDA